MRRALLLRLCVLRAANGALMGSLAVRGRQVQVTVQAALLGQANLTLSLFCLTLQPSASAHVWTNSWAPSALRLW